MKVGDRFRNKEHGHLVEVVDDAALDAGRRGRIIRYFEIDDQTYFSPVGVLERNFEPVR